MGETAAASRQPAITRAYQHQIDRTGRQQRHRERDGQAFTGGLKRRPHNENIGRFYPVSLGDYFSGSPGGFRTRLRPQGLQPAAALPGFDAFSSREPMAAPHGMQGRLSLENASWPDSRRNGRRTRCNPKPLCALGHSSGAEAMPYALFCHEAKLSKAYPTEADVWKQARQSGLVVDVATEEEKAAPRPVAGQRLRNQAVPAGPAGRSRQEPGRRRARRAVGASATAVNHFLVVPANAGIHNHRELLSSEGVCQSLQRRLPRSMGPGVRRDDA